MPLHAAGDYSKGGAEHRAYNYAVSSYIPTLKTLIPETRGDFDGAFSGILAVSEPSTLPGTTREVEAITKHAGSSLVTHLNAAAGTKSDVLRNMAQHSWIHFACHGIQDKDDPLKSAFKLHDGELTLSDIMRTSVKRSGLAFLSACQTATGHDDLPDEAIHLAAGMLSAGYSSVIGTMWSIQDDDAPLVAEEVYSRIVDRERGTADVRMAAWALHEATAKLREAAGETSFVRWVPFIHLGL
jgi:CHAT domain-containing protein